jgi:hypothetical protein
MSAGSFRMRRKHGHARAGSLRKHGHEMLVQVAVCLKITPFQAHYPARASADARAGGDARTGGLVHDTHLCIMSGIMSMK